MTRDQLRKLTIKENPELMTLENGELFREAFVLNAINHTRAEAQRQYQRATSLDYLADFLGMSKGEVTKHLQSITKKIEEAQKNVKERTDNAAPSDTDAGGDLDTTKNFTPTNGSNPDDSDNH